MKFKPGHSPSAEAVRAFIHILREDMGVELPDDYRAFLEQHPGGEPTSYEFCYVGRKSGKTRRVTVDYFPVISPSGRYRHAFSFLLKTYVATRRVPRYTLPICVLPGSDLILLKLKGGDDYEEGNIFIWRHEEEEVVSAKEWPSYGNCAIIAATFSEFLSLFA